jgi:hypothetical protein
MIRSRSRRVSSSYALVVREGQGVTVGIETNADERELVPTAWRDLAARFDFN